MKATADLRSEHGGVKTMLDVMDAMAGRLEEGSPLPDQHFSEVFEFLRVFVDQCHHYKEESLLFPALASVDGEALAETIDVLRTEHERGRQTLVRMEAAAAALSSEEPAAATALAGTLRGYTELLRDHIIREERDCFDVADAELPSGKQDELAEGYDRVEDEVIGQGRHEAFHAMIDRLSAEYTG